MSDNGDSLSHGAGPGKTLSEGAQPKTGAKPTPTPAVKPSIVGPKGGAGNSGATSDD